MTISRCFKAWPREGDCYVGYLFATSRGKARALAMQTDPGGSPPWLPEDFTVWHLIRLPHLDGKAPAGSAWWGPSDVPVESGVKPSDLWHEDNE